MTKFQLLTACLLTITTVSAQESVEMKGLRTKEMQSFEKKMTSFNNNPNTQNYDLQYQRMDVTLNPMVYQISGSVTSHFKPNQSISSIYFDLSDELSVSQVTYHGTSIPYQQLGTKEVKIDFPAALPSQVLDSLTIHYSGAPATNNNAFSTGSQGGIPLLATLNEPYGAQDWFPTKQSLNDKIDRFDLKITTPSQYNVAANGKLMSETALANGQKLTFWRTQYPTAAYLIALGITNYVKINDTMGNPPFPFINYLYPSTVSNTANMNNIAWTKTVMNTFENYFGAYPFRNEKYGHMEFQFGGGMEHQTMSSMGAWSNQLIAHELAHQWFGDKVTCGQWNDIWLNEGFATFGEHLANEKLLMSSADFLTYLQGEKDYITSSPSGSVYVADANLGNINAIFNSRLSYAKGGYVVRMLKWVLGETAFYQAIKEYHARPNLAYNYAKTSDLTNSLFQSTGKDFTEFFNDWIYGQGYPTYDIRWKQVGTFVTFKAKQTQSHSSVSFFEMPLPIKVIGTSGQIAHLVLNHTSNDQYFTEALSFPVASVQFNEEYQILEKNSTVILDAALSTMEVSKEEISLYPNPAKNEVNLKGIDKSLEYNIYSADGKLVRKNRYTPKKSIDISDLIPGIYFITIKENTLKFMKK